MSKGYQRRPLCTGREENDLRENLRRGKITREQFDVGFETLKEQGLIMRDGRVIQ